MKGTTSQNVTALIFLTALFSFIYSTSIHDGRNGLERDMNKQDVVP